MGKARSESIARGVRIRRYETGTEVLEIQFQYKGQTCREVLHGLAVTKANQRFAINKKNQIEYEKGMNTFSYADHFPNSPKAKQFGEARTDITVGEVLTQYVSDIERSKEHSTFRAYKKSVEGVLLPALGKYLLTDLADNPEPIREMIRKREVTLKTIRNDLTPLRAVFDQAVTDNLCSRNPMDKIKVKLLAKKRKTTTRTADPLSLEEVIHFLQTAAHVKPKWKNYWQFAFFSGLRPSELYALEKKDVNLDKHSISVNKAIVERKAKGTKTDAGKRTIDLLPMAEAAIRAELEQHISNNEQVWINPVTRRPIIDYEESSRAWRYILNAAKIRYRSQYQARHTFCSNLLSGGENIYYVAQQMGHKDVEMVMKVYGKWVEEGSKKRRRVWVSEFGNRTE